MLSSLQIQNFRGLKDVKINSLGRVNLIVGENNAGKSSVLEALRIYASGGNPYVLDEIAKSHNEESLLRQYEQQYHNFDNKPTPFSDFFYQRKYPKSDNENILIGELNKNVLNLCFFDFDIVYGIDVMYQSKKIRAINFCLFDKNDYSEIYNNYKENKIIDFKYVPTQIMDDKNLPLYWDKIILTPYENEVIKSLQIIEPDIEKLAFINQPFNDKNRIPMVGLKNSEKPIPLYSMGDGMKRILQLILNLHQAKDGLLLIDEFDNGLHYKVQEKVWGLLFELAERFNVQVFATTHSNDCIRAFSKISKERTDIDGMLIQMTKEYYKDGTSQIVANVVDEESLECLLNLGVDVR